MKLYRLLERIQYSIKCGQIDCGITAIVQDSTRVIPNSVFVCIKTDHIDGHDFVEQAIIQGATVIIAEKMVEVPDGITLILVSNTTVALAYMAAAYYDYPAERLTTIGVTGTKGKTTTSYMLHKILEKAGIQTGLIGSIEVIIGEARMESYTTTPDSVLLQRYMAQMVDEGITTVIVEVSCSGFCSGCVEGITFDYGIVTNVLSSEVEFEEVYLKQCKVGIINEDSQHLSNLLKEHSCRIETYGLHRTAFLYAYQPKLLQRPGNLGVQFRIGGVLNSWMELWMPGLFNIYNALAAIQVARHFHIHVDVMREALAEVLVKGRLEVVEVSSEFTVMIDSAQDIDRLRCVLATVAQYRPKRIVCMFGCDGSCSEAMCQDVGKVVSQYADESVVTSDNPKDKDGKQIIEEIWLGMKDSAKSCMKIEDREEAIRYCIEHAKQGDVLVLAGKGHETYQEIKGVRYHLDEREIIKNVKKHRDNELEASYVQKRERIV